MIFKIRLFITKLILIIVDIIEPSYWKCTWCGSIKLKEEETRCWECHIGEMVYKGKISVNKKTVV